MTDMPQRGLVFLSHHANDKPVVEPVFRGLDPATTFYDTRSIGPGQSTLEAMKEAAANAAVFVLFHSENSHSDWVEFEKNLAEVEKITARHMRIVVHPVGEASYRTLPDWMKRYMTTTPQYRTNDLVRTVQSAHSEALEGLYPELVQEYPGREALVRQVSLDVMRSAAQTGGALNVVVLTGVQGMGRGTVATQISKLAFRGLRPAGPIFDLPRNADAVDWHLRFHEDLHGRLSADEAKRQSEAFSALSPSSQADMLLNALSHWGNLNQVVTIRSRWGLRDRGRALRPWLDHLLTLLASRPDIRLVLISERQLPVEVTDKFPNTKQYSVDPLNDETIEYILGRRIDPRFMKLERLSSISRKVHGHPATSNYVSYLINNGRSMDSLEVLPEPIHAFQDKVLKEIFDDGILSDNQRKVLKLLSWFPLLSADILVEAFPEADKDTILTELWELSDFSLVEQSEQGRYRVPTIVASSYRRSSKEHDRESFSKVAGLLEQRFSKDAIDIDLVESLLIGIVAERGEIPLEFTSFLTPSNLLGVVESEYYAALGASDEEASTHFERAGKLGSLAMSMTGSEDTIENILFYAADSFVRNGDYPSEIISYMRTKGFLSVEYIEGSYLYHKKRDYAGAAACLNRTLSGKNFMLRNVRLLARIHLRTGKFADALDVLAKVHEGRLARDVGLIVMKIRALRGVRNYDEARKLEPLIADKEDDYGEHALYRATQAFRSSQYKACRGHIADARKAPRSNKLTLRLLECASEIEEGENQNLAETCAVARSAGRDADALQLQARAALYAGNWRDAEQYMAQVDHADYFDLAVMSRIIDHKLTDFEVSSDPVALAAARGERDDVIRRMTLGSEISRY